MRCSSEPRGAAAALALPPLLLLLAGCAGTAAPAFAPPSPAMRNLPLFVGSHGGVNTGDGPASVGVGVARQVQLVSGSGVRVTLGSASADAAAAPNGLTALRTPQQLLEAGLLALQASAARVAPASPGPLRPGSD